MLVIEDLHFADEATLDLVGHLARRLRGRRALVVATYRDDGLAENRALRETLGEASSPLHSPDRVAAALTPDAVARSATASGHEPAALHALTGGNPFFVSEVLYATTDELPASARDAVLARAARLSPAGRDVLDAAALIGERVEPDLLATVTGADVRTLDEPVAAGLLVADGDGLRFRHEIARRAVEQEVGPHAAADMHRRILAALVRSGVDDDARLAHHAEGALDARATSDTPAAPGDRSASLASRREAVAQYRRALRFVRHRPTARTCRPAGRARSRAGHPRPVGAGRRGAGGVDRALARRRAPRFARVTPCAGSRCLLPACAVGPT